MDLIDIGANLGHDSFDHDRDAVLERARDAGVAAMVVTGASRKGSPRALELAQAHPGMLYATAGVHPHHAVEYTDECDAEMRALHEALAPGDVAGVRLDNPYVRPPTPPPDLDLALWQASVERILALHPQTLYLTHFGPFTDVDRHFYELGGSFFLWLIETRGTELFLEFYRSKQTLRHLEGYYGADIATLAGEWIAFLTPTN